MKTIGLIGGTGWISSLEYYRIINRKVNEKLGGLNSAKCILYSVNYSEIDECNKRNDRRGVFRLISEGADRLYDAGAECILLCANTLHQFADELENKIPIPLIHIAEATAKQINKAGLKKVGLLGTKQTMEMDFYKSKLAAEGISTLIPNNEDMDIIQYIINYELLKEIFTDESVASFQNIMNRMKDSGAEGIILGCTEIPLLIKQEHSPLPLFNTLIIHAYEAVDFALK